MHFLPAAQSVSSLDIFFQMRSYIYGTASYRIAYKKYIDISYKLDIPPSPCMYVNIYTILPKVLGRPLLLNRFDYFSNFYECKS